MQLRPTETTLNSIRVIGAKGLIGFGLQGDVNDASRHREATPMRHGWMSNAALTATCPPRIRTTLAIAIRDTMLR